MPAPPSSTATRKKGLLRTRCSQQPSRRQTRAANGRIDQDVAHDAVRSQNRSSALSKAQAHTLKKSVEVRSFDLHAHLNETDSLQKKDKAQ